MNDIIEGNKLIAEFMELHIEWRVDEYKVFMWMNKDNMLVHECNREEGEYHSSWDWLIPVWNKLWFTQVSFEKSIEWNNIKGNNCARAILYGTVEEAAKEIANAIKWYNNTKNKNYE
jgi:hypothetical protein